MPKNFKGSAPVVRDLSGERERDREFKTRFQVGEMER